MRSLFLTPALADHAYSLVAPAITHILSTSAKRQALHVTILDGVVPFEDTAAGFKNALRFDRVAVKDAWVVDYETNARTKARMSWRARMDTLTLITVCPTHLQHADSKYAGGVWRDGVVVGVSGVEQYFDHMIAAIIAEACIGHPTLAGSDPRASER
jgi:hypothetical protein